MDSIRFILLDADGVVQVPSANWRASLANIAGDPTQAETLLTEIFTAEKQCTTGEVEFAPLLAEILGRWNPELAPDAVLDLWTLIDPHSPTLGFVDELRAAGYQVALATNQQPHRASYMKSALGYDQRFDHLFISCDLGVAKPEPQFFETILSRLGAASHEVLFVDDHPANVAAAQAVGLHAEVYDLGQGIDVLRGLLDQKGIVC